MTRHITRQFFRLNCLPRILKSHYCTEGAERGGDQLETFTGPVPRDKLTVNFSRSSGPGGQNVNKLNTKAEIRFHLDSADWLPQRVKDRVKSMFKKRLTKEGDLVVVSQVHRTQHKNLDDAVQRLTSLLKEASEIPKGPSELTLARIRVLKRKADRKRRTDKKYHSVKKQDRRDDF